MSTDFRKAAITPSHKWWWGGSGSGRWVLAQPSGPGVVARPGQLARIECREDGRFVVMYLKGVRFDGEALPTYSTLAEAKEMVYVQLELEA